MEFMLVVVLLWTTIFVFLSTLVYRWIFSSKDPQVPRGPSALPIIGHLHLLGPNLHRSFHQLSLHYGPLLHLRLGSVPCVVASTPELAREFLKTNELSFSSRKLTPAIKLVTYDASFAFAPYGPFWKFIKKLATQELLGSTNLRNFEKIRKMEVHAFLSDLMRKAKVGEEVNVTEEIMNLANNIISQMMFSLRCSDGESDQAQQARTVIREVTEIFGEFDVSDIIGFGGSLDLQGIRKRAKNIHTRYDTLLEKIISDREILRSAKRLQNKEDGGSNEANDFLDMLLDTMENQTGEVKVTRNNIKAVILDFFTAATDTTSIAIEWALVELINNPRVLEKAQEEINKVVEGKHRLAEESDTPHLPYIQAIIKETFRLHPPIPMLIRKSVNECNVAGSKIPAHALLFVNIWSIGRNEKYWENPLEFRPERFLEPNGDGDPSRIRDIKGHHFELLPFGTGRRGCPGMSLAILELPNILALILQCFDFEVPTLHAGKTEGTALDMAERPGLTAPRANDLICRLKSRIDHPLNILSSPQSQDMF
ncbi:licodione synthase-like [Coffea eugenioides]|uniref:licodione synthase-like n=1 Tax=Coffea eugenioides TaxID=49369 RepID=UPI000F60DB5B|nr:licodione synthase-like [Coffea eugenioides]